MNSGPPKAHVFLGIPQLGNSGTPKLLVALFLSSQIYSSWKTTGGNGFPPFWEVGWGCGRNLFWCDFFFLSWRGSDDSLGAIKKKNRKLTFYPWDFFLDPENNGTPNNGKLPHAISIFLGILYGNLYFCCWKFFCDHEPCKLMGALEPQKDGWSFGIWWFSGSERLQRGGDGLRWTIKKPPGILLPSCLGIIISHFKDPYFINYQYIIKVRLFFSWLM